MAGWLTSKLKAAEQFLQQIDQQAAESLKRSDNGMPLPFTLTEDNPPGPSQSDNANSAGVTISEQGYFFSKMPTQKSLAYLEKASGEHNDQASLNNMSLDGQKTETRKLASNSPADHAPGKVSKEDWTELLGSPALIGNSSISRASSVGSSDLGVSSNARGMPIKSPFYSVKGQNISGIIAPTTVSRAAKQQPVQSTVVPASHQVQLTEKLLSNRAGVNKKFYGDPVRRNLDLDANSDQNGNSEFQDIRLEDAESSIEEGQSSRFHKKQIKLANGDENYSGRVESRVDEDSKVPLSGQEDKTNVLKEVWDQNLDFLETQQTAVESLKLRGSTAIDEERDDMNTAAHNHLVRTSLDHVSVLTEHQPADSTVENTHELGQIAYPSEADNLIQVNMSKAPVLERNEGLEKHNATRYKNDEVAKDTAIFDFSILTNNGLGNEPDSSRRDQDAISIPEKDHVSDTETEVDSDTDSEYEENLQRLTAEKRRLVERKTAELAAAEAANTALKEREELVERLEKEKENIEHALEEREEKQAKEAEELRTSMKELLEAVELEKQRHTMTRKEAVSKDAKLEPENAQLAKALAAAQWNLDKELSHLIQLRSKVDAQKVSKADLERKIAKLNSWISHPHTPQVEEALNVELDYGSVAEEKTEILSKIDHCKMQIKDLEEKLADAKNVRQTSTAVELELEHRLNQLTEHLIQKQAQAEELSMEKATLIFRLEALSNCVRDKKSALDSPSTTRNKGVIYDWSAVDDDLEYGTSKLHSSKNKSSIDAYNGLHRNMHAKALISQFLECFHHRIDSLFLGGAHILRMHKLARALAGFYLLALHCWVLFILFLHSNRDSSSIADSSSVLSVANSADVLNATSKS